MNLGKIIPKDGPSIEEVERYVKKYSNELIVIKCGGSVLLDKNLFNQFIEDISVINKLGLSAIVVHGGGKNIKKKLDQHNIESKFINGLRVTNEKTIKIVEEALLELNTEILNNINNKGANAKSVTPKNENLIKIIPEKKELGFVGTPKEINKEVLLSIVGEKKVPIIVPLGIGDDGKIYNINADVAAASIAKEINSVTAKDMIKDQSISGGMIPKINTCIDAVNNGVTGVVIVDGRKQNSLLFEIFSDKGSGTLIRK